MAVKKFKKTKKYNFKHKKANVVKATIAIIIFSFIFSSSISNYVQAAQYNKQKNELLENMAVIESENIEIDEILKDKKKRNDYVEKIAREKYNYRKPDEKVFYDSSYK